MLKFFISQDVFFFKYFRILGEKLPNISVSNGLECDPIPEELKLTDLEEQFIARSLIFMKLIRLPKSRMPGVKDRIVNVPMREEDISKTIHSLPRTQNASGMVAVKWKRKMEMKNCHMEEYVRPSRLIEAVKKLKDIGNPFYQDIKVDENFYKTNDGDENMDVDEARLI